MTANAQKLLDDALMLSQNDRAQLAAELLASLDAVEQDVEAAWAAEIAQRAADARENPEDEYDWRSALAEVSV
jgi:putative addiction module component (TIGR02574 family)